ncbi:hypothetical protein AXA44_02540 [Rhodococcus sp. SC4]|nr:hypothetical protein AXA44_02540 [Rhodococcus sp. SC4]
MLGTRLTAAVCGAMQISVGLLYLGPSQFVRRPLPPDQINLVQYIESAGPYWVIGFVLSGVVLLAASVRRRGFVIGHAVAVFIWAFYGSAVLIGAVMSEPPTPILTGSISVWLALMHAALAYGCAERGYR